MQTPYSDLSFTVLKTVRSNIRCGAPEDGHNDARNMLRANGLLINQNCYI